MLPQAIVQNTILGSYTSAGKFVINWEKAAPIINLNFFYNEQAVEESNKYRKLLRPWTPVTAPTSGLIPAGGFHTHNYYYAVTRIDLDPDDPSYPRVIYPGSLVGCINIIDDKPNLAIVYPNIGQYVYSPYTGEFNFSSDVTQPVLFRSASVAGLQEVHVVPLNPENDLLTITSDFITYRITNNTAWKYCRSFKYSDDNAYFTHLLLPTDMIFGRVKYQNAIIEEVPVQVNCTLNSRLGKYEYSLTIPNHNYVINSDTVVEFY